MEEPSTRSLAGGSNNYINTDDYNSIVGGYLNTIDSGSTYSFIGGGYQNIINNGGDYCTISGGHLNTITNGTEHAFIGGGYLNYILNQSNYSAIVSGNNNRLTNGSLNAFIGSGVDNIIMDNDDAINDGSNYCSILNGWHNYIEGTAYSSILGGNYNNLGGFRGGGQIYSSFILGASINTQSGYRTGTSELDYVDQYAYSLTTYMNNTFLWDRGLLLKDKSANIGDVLVVESINDGMPIVTWGSVSGGGSYSGTDPIPGSTGSYTSTSKGSSILLSSYVVVQSSEDTLGNTDGMVGTTFDATGYNFTNVAATTYASIISDMVGASSPGLVIEDGYRYQIDVDLITLTWGGYSSVNRPRLTLSYTPPIIFSTTNYTFGSNVGTISGNITLSDSNNANYQFTTSDSGAPTTSGPYLMLTYNTTSKKINFILSDIYASSRYVYKMPTIYNSASGGSTMDITWNPSLYPIPTTSDFVTLWQNDPATNGGNPNISIASVVGNIVTINTNYGLQVNQPCWVFVKGRMPVVSVKLNYTVTKTAI